MKGFGARLRLMQISHKFPGDSKNTVFSGMSKKQILEFVQGAYEHFLKEASSLPVDSETRKEKYDGAMSISKVFVKKNKTPMVVRNLELEEKAKP